MTVGNLPSLSKDTTIRKPPDLRPKRHNKREKRHRIRCFPLSFTTVNRYSKPPLPIDVDAPPPAPLLPPDVTYQFSEQILMSITISHSALLSMNVTLTRFTSVSSYHKLATKFSSKRSEAEQAKLNGMLRYQRDGSRFVESGKDKDATLDGSSTHESGSKPDAENCSFNFSARPIQLCRFFWALLGSSGEITR